MRELCISAAQAASTRGAVAATLDHHCQLAELAAEIGVDVVVCPELSTTGCEPDIAPTLAFSTEDERLEPLVRIANARAIVLIVGAPVRLRSGLHIGAFIPEPGGIRRIYTKRHLHGGEESVFEPGTLDPILEVGDDRAALAICADTSRPEHAAAAAMRDASLYLVGVFFSPEGYSRDTNRIASYAERHAMAVVMADSGGPATGFRIGRWKRCLVGFGISRGAPGRHRPWSGRCQEV